MEAVEAMNVSLAQDPFHFGIETEVRGGCSAEYTLSSFATASTRSPRI